MPFPCRELARSSELELRDDCIATDDIFGKPPPPPIKSYRRAERRRRRRRQQQQLVTADVAAR